MGRKLLAQVAGRQRRLGADRGGGARGCGGRRGGCCSGYRRRIEGGVPHGGQRVVDGGRGARAAAAPAVGGVSQGRGAIAIQR